MENKIKELNLAAYAHLGDAIYEVFVRELVVWKFQKISNIHKYTTSFVRASFQEEMLFVIEPMLTPQEADIVRRGRNLPLTKQKLNNQTTHRHATAFEVLIGFLYVQNKERLDEIFAVARKEIEKKLDK